MAHLVRFKSGVPVVFGTAISVASMLLERDPYRRDGGPFRIEFFNPTSDPRIWKVRQRVVDAESNKCDRELLGVR
jgi:hypothetical protein